MSSFEFDEVDVFTAGALGEPGQRVFYIQARHGAQVASFRLEKQQVAAVAEYFERLLADLPPPPEQAVEQVAADLELAEPVVAEWVVGQIGLGHDEVTDRILVVAEEVQLDPDDSADPDDVGLGGLLHDEPSTARFSLTRAQAEAFIERARQLVRSGRPLCRLCGRPMDPEGHICPRTNGHKPR